MATRLVLSHSEGLVSNRVRESASITSTAALLAGEKADRRDSARSCDCRESRVSHANHAVLQPSLGFGTVFAFRQGSRSGMQHIDAVWRQGRTPFLLSFQHFSQAEACYENYRGSLAF